MTYTRVGIDALGYELPPWVVTTRELEARLQPVFEALRLPAGQLEAWTGIVERRWWEPGSSLTRSATTAARQALAAAAVPAGALDVVVYAAVCREHFEPATACHVAAALGVGPNAVVYDVSNACLGVLNAMADVANRIELRQCRAGLVVACESAREINEATIDRLRKQPQMDLLRSSLATLTGGSGAVAVLLTDGSFPSRSHHRLLGGVARTAPQHADLCRWGLEEFEPFAFRPVAATDAVAVLQHGVGLGRSTWEAFLDHLGWHNAQVDRVICHQVSAGHQAAMLDALGIGTDRDFTTFRHLGNMGTVSLPLTAALAEERHVLRPGDRVGFLGIGSGLNCLMLGVEW